LNQSSLSAGLAPVFGIFMALHLSALPGAAEVVASGTFQSKEAGLVAGGTFEVQENAGKYTLVVNSDFKVSEGPDLYFAFHPLAASAVTGGNAKTGAFRVDPMLRSLKGAQTYAIKDGFDPSAYKSVIIHCWKYNHLYAAAVLKPAATTAVKPGGSVPKAKRTKAKPRATVIFEKGETGAEVDAAGRLHAGPAGSP
jgi:hypothetical protein